MEQVDFVKEYIPDIRISNLESIVPVAAVADIIEARPAHDLSSTGLEDLYKNIVALFAAVENKLDIGSHRCYLVYSPLVAYICPIVSDGICALYAENSGKRNDCHIVCKAECSLLVATLDGAIGGGDDIPNKRIYARDDNLAKWF